MSVAELAAAREGRLIEGRYRLVELIARGAMGEVHAAHDEWPGNKVALKRLREATLVEPLAVERFRAEFRALRALDHPRIIQVYHYGHDGALPYYTMELLDGADLRQLAPLPYRQACSLLRDVASSIALLHARRLLHRDLSPRNVRRTSDGRCKLIDFGTMAPFGNQTNVAGTAPLLPPEALRGDALDQRADLYSLGALSYFVLTGRHAYDARTFEELPACWGNEPPRVRRFDDSIPKALDDLIVGLMMANPRGRPASAAEVIELLSAHADHAADDSLEVARSYVSRTALVGRGREQLLIERRIERAARGRGGVILVQGLPGVGKTRLLQDAELVAETHGLRTIGTSARTHAGERAVSAALVTALEASATDASAGTSSLLSDELRAVVLASRPPGDRAQSGPEARARLQAMLADRFTAAACVRPMLVCVDDLDRADEFSMAFLAALAVEAQQLPILVLCSSSRGPDELRQPAFETFCGGAERISLTALGESQTAELLASSFGAVPHVNFAANWVFKNAHGNPAMSVELVQHLVDSGVATYANGGWILPDTEIIEEVPQQLERALLLRIGRLSAHARTLSEVLAVHGDGAVVDDLAAASGLSTEVTDAAVQELLNEGVIERADTQVSFRLAAVGDAVQQTLEPHRVRELHRTWAHALLQRGSGAPGQDGTDNMAHRLRAGWHLSHTIEELRGAEILAALGPRLLFGGLTSGAAATAMERALEIYERHGKSLSTRLAMRTYLTMAGYLCDVRLAHRYGEAVIADLHRIIGLARVERLQKFVGARLALLLSLGAMQISRLFLPASRRPPGPVHSVLYFARATSALMGVRVTHLDGPGTAALASMVGALARSGIPGVAESAMACEALALQPQGKEASLRRALEAVLPRVERLIERPLPTVPVNDLQMLRVGLMLALGINEAYRPGPGALAFADRLSALGSDLASVCAERIRMVYHCVRGHRDEVERSRRLIEVHGIQGGSTWQVNAFSLPIEGMCGALYGDVVTTRRALDRLEKLVGHEPSMIPMRDMVRMGYHHARGDHAKAAELGLAFAAAHPPRSVIGWGTGYAVAAGSLLEIGRTSEALALCRRGVEALPDEDREYFALYLALEGVHAMAEVLGGDAARGEALFDGMLARLNAHDEVTMIALLHEVRARMARKRGDRRGLMLSLAELTRAAHTSRSPALIAHVDRITDISTRMTVGSDPPRHGGRGIERTDSAETAVLATHEETLVTRVLQGYQDMGDRALHALRLLAQCAGAADGFLIMRDAHDGTRSTSLAQQSPPEELERKMSEFLARGRGGSQGRLVIPDGARAEGSVARYRMVLLRGADSLDCIAVVALRESDDGLLKLRPALLEQVGRSLG